MNFSSFLQNLINDNNFYIKVNESVDDIVNLIDSGLPEKKILENYKKNGKFLYTFAKNRIKVRKKFTKYNRLFLDDYAARYSTPETVGLYRSGRLASSDIVDIGSGAGMQSIMFSYNSQVEGVEVDRNRYLMSILNKKAYDSNPEFINGDAFDIKINFREKLIFSDPLRPESAKLRSFDELIPDPRSILKLAGAYRGYVFDLPPQIGRDKIVLKGEREYISVSGNLNRLTLYSDDISQDEYSAVMLPENIRISGSYRNYNESPQIIPSGSDYLYVPDISIIYAGLVNKILKDDFIPVYIDARRIVFSGNIYYKEFPGEVFKIINNAKYEELEKVLKMLNAKNIYFRFGIDPEYYYKFKNSLEKSLEGEKNVYIFKNDENYILAIKMEKSKVDIKSDL